MNSGRDQVQILKDMITDEFTVKTGIPVNLSLVQTGFVEATLAGAGPDVFIGIPRGQPVNLACRGALADLSGFDTYKDVMARFSDTAAVPYTFNDGVYAVPEYPDLLYDVLPHRHFQQARAERPADLG